MPERQSYAAMTNEEIYDDVAASFDQAVQGGEKPSDAAAEADSYMHWLFNKRRADRQAIQPKAVELEIA